MIVLVVATHPSNQSLNHAMARLNQGSLGNRGRRLGSAAASFSEVCDSCSRVPLLYGVCMIHACSNIPLAASPQAPVLSMSVRVESATDSFRSVTWWSLTSPERLDFLENRFQVSVEHID